MILDWNVRNCINVKSIDGSVLSLAGFNLRNPKIQEYDNFKIRFKSNSDNYDL